MSDSSSAGRELHARLLPRYKDAPLRDGGFADELRELSQENLFGRIWTRPALDLRSRSLVTLGILIAQRATEEMALHFEIALRNGLTVDELEEVIYQSTGYAGFPAAVTARRTAREVVERIRSEEPELLKNHGAVPAGNK